MSSTVAQFSTISPFKNLLIASDVEEYPAPHYVFLVRLTTFVVTKIRIKNQWGFLRRCIFSNGL